MYDVIILKLLIILGNRIGFRSFYLKQSLTVISYNNFIPAFAYF